MNTLSPAGQTSGRFHGDADGHTGHRTAHSRTWTLNERTSLYEDLATKRASSPVPRRTGATPIIKPYGRDNSPDCIGHCRVGFVAA